MRNLKKVISSVAALAIVASSASAFAVTFPDVDESASYANAVSALTALGIVNGDDNGLFNPDNSVTRAEFTKLVVEARGEGNAATSQTSSKFADAANTSVHWAAGYVAQGVSDGFIDGYSDTQFGPDDKVTYAQAAKMLVAAIGYTTYAEAAGGWPSGYVSEASTLGITKGVSASNDTELTRAQCAVMVYNATQVPLCMISGYDTVADGKGGFVSAPTTEVYDGEGKDYKTLLTEYHDAYIVKGRVTATSQSEPSLDSNEVKYKVEVADNFDDICYKTAYNNDEEFDMYDGDTNAQDLLFSYTQALVQKNDDEDSYTILAIEEYGKSKSVEFSTDDVATTEEYNAAANNKIAVFKSKSSSTTTKYDLADEVDIYVNGRAISDDLTTAIDKYVDGNQIGTLTLIDETKVGSTSTDGKYEYIMITYYVDAVVSSTQTSSTAARVYFNGSAINRFNSLKWDPDNEDILVKFTKNGEEIAYTDLNEYDILTIYANPDADLEGGELQNDDYAIIQVSDNTVVGKVTSTDPTDLTVTADGTEYDIASDNLITLNNFTLGDEYTLYLDVYGYVAWQEEGTTAKNYGVVVAVYQSAGNDEATVRLITGTGDIVNYEAKESSDAEKAYNILTGNTGYDGDTYNKGKAAVKTNIESGATAVTYKLSSGKIKNIEALTAANDTENLEYRASTTKLGGFSIDDSVSQILDLSNYIDDDTVGTVTVSDFEDEVDYDAYVYEKSSSSSVYKFVVVWGGFGNLRAKTDVAVVMQNKGQQNADDDTECIKYIVAKDGVEDVEVLVDETAKALYEGDVIQYVVSADGYVKDDGVEVLFSAKDYDSYASLLKATVAKTDFNDMLNADGVKLIDKDDDVEVTFGIVYRVAGNNLEVFKTQADGQSNVTKAESFSVAGAKSYVFDYENKAKYRVEVGSYSQNNSIFKQVYADAKETLVDWATAETEEVAPALVLVKEVEKDVVAVVYFTGEF